MDVIMEHIYTTRNCCAIKYKVYPGKWDEHEGMEERGFKWKLMGYLLWNRIEYYRHLYHVYNLI